jgi:hypothetical protein
MSISNRKIFTGKQKARSHRQRSRGIKTSNKIAQEYEVHQASGESMKKELLENVDSLLEGKSGPKPPSGILEFSSNLKGVISSSGENHIIIFVTKINKVPLRNTIILLMAIFCIGRVGKQNSDPRINNA